MITPLKRLGDGAWRSNDKAWIFLILRDVEPRRWLVFEGASKQPVSLTGHQTLGEAVAWATERSVADRQQRDRSFRFFAHKREREANATNVTTLQINEAGEYIMTSDGTEWSIFSEYDGGVRWFSYMVRRKGRAQYRLPRRPVQYDSSADKKSTKERMKLHAEGYELMLHKTIPRAKAKKWLI